jgi:hypothetical protein
MAMTDEPTSIHTGGGLAMSGNVDTGGRFIGRDQHGFNRYQTVIIQGERPAQPISPA